MDLKKLIENIVKESLGNNSKGLKNISNAEKFFKQSYEGRYFFELIQNVRDANRELGIEGEIFINIDNKKLTIANTGAEFSENGIISITNIGESTKNSQEYIGHKGIGFKSVLEITETPRIITRYGTFFFDRKQTINKYNKKVGQITNNIPLFFFPHYDSATISSTEKNVVTKIELPYKKKIKYENVLKDFQNIGHKQLVLLGNIKKILCETQEGHFLYTIENNKNNTVKITYNDDSFFYKKYSPKNEVEIPYSVIDLLDDEEKNLFKNKPYIEINILLQLNKKKNFIPVDDAKLYLFYPLNVTTGFNFLLHSYFIVSPDRKVLRSSPFNEFLLKKIGEYISGQFLTQLKNSYRSLKILEILYYERIADSGLNTLYETIKIELSQKKFIFDVISKKFYKPNEIIAADGFDKSLFPDGIIDNKRLIFIDNKKVLNWLITEFEVTYLTYESIANAIENECIKHKKNKNIKFFQDLYNYVNKHEKLNLTGKRVLLTSSNKLVSSNENVFYRGRGSSRQSAFPKTIENKIFFIHQDIQISDFREGRSKTGIKEYSTYELICRLVELFNDNTVPNKDIINAVISQDLDTKSIYELKEEILLPVERKAEWYSPITTPIYFNKPELKNLYPVGCFIDMTIFSSHPLEKVEYFLKEMGVWDIPAVYLDKSEKRVDSNSEINKQLDLFSKFTSRPFIIQNDRLLDIPQKPNKWFTEQIINNWTVYKKYITNNILPTLKYRSHISRNWNNLPDDNLFLYTGFCNYLKRGKWIVLDNTEEALGCKDVVGIDDYDSQQSHMKVVSRYLKTIPSTYPLVHELFELLGIPHLNTENIENFEAIFRLIYHNYHDNIQDEKELILFYNKILNKLYNCYIQKKENEEKITELIGIPMLALNDINNQIVWVQSQKIFYRDIPGFYKQLPNNVKELLQPQFTNQDKNTIGRIVSKLGVRISRALSFNLLEDNDLEEKPILSEYPLLPEMISLLEYDLDRSINEEEMSNIKNAIVVKRKSILLEIKISGKTINTLSQSYFSQKSNIWRLYIIDDPLENKINVLAEAINNLFASVIGKELRRVETDIKDLLTSKNYNDLLDKLNISMERIKEIKGLLESKLLNNKQLFYDNLLKSRGVSYDVIYFPYQEVSHEAISSSLGTNNDILIEFEKGFDFDEINTPKNIIPLKNLFDNLGVTLEEYNKYSSLLISFEKYHIEKLNQIKNKFEFQFKNWLHNFLKNKTLELQSKYLSYQDTYKDYTFLNINKNFIMIDYYCEFDKWLKNQFPELNLSQSELEKCIKDTNFNKIFNDNKKRLIKDLKRNNLSNNFLEDFLSVKSIKSLLFFPYSEIIFEKYKLKYINQIDQHSSLEETGNTQLTDYKNDNDTIISISKPTLPNTNIKDRKTTTLSKHPKSLDGSQGKKQKEHIGLVAEMLVYDLLKKSEEINNLVWVSKNASKVDESYIGYNPEGDDSYSYDLEYLDSEGNKFVVEVKGKNSNEKIFEISRSELEVAFSKGKYYRLIFVSNVLDNDSRTFRDLGNPFIFDAGEDFMYNKKFKAINSNYEIYFE